MATLKKTPPCLRCGDALKATVASVDTPPWVCEKCHRGYWDAEVSGVGRQMYRSTHDDFGVPGVALAQLQEDIRAERAKLTPPPSKVSKARMN